MENTVSTSNNPFKINPLRALLAIDVIRAASKLNKQDFDKYVAQPANAKIAAKIAKVTADKSQTAADDKRYVLPAGMTEEQHLFNLTFNDPNRRIKVVDQTFRMYDPAQGCWVHLNEDRLKYEILQHAKRAKYPDSKTRVGKSLGTIANVERTLKFAATELYSNVAAINNHHLLAFRNGIVSTTTGQLSPHDLEAYLTASLPYDYQPDCPCPAPMLEYIKTSFGDDQVDYVRAALGLVLDLTAPDRFIHAIGPSGSGKGVFVKLVEKFFGAEFVTAPGSFEIFAKPESIHQYLSGKRLCYWDDIIDAFGYGNSVNVFYSAVERAPLNARSLFNPKGYPSIISSRYIMASTAPLNSRNSTSKGWERRVFPLPTISGGKNDDTMKTRLFECIAEIISWALAMPKELRNSIIKNPKYYNPLAEQYFHDAAISSSTVFAFAAKCLRPVTPKPGDTHWQQAAVNDSQFYSAYRAFCAETGRSPSSMDKFKYELREILPSNTLRRIKIDGVQYQERFVYLDLIDQVFSYTENGMVRCHMQHIDPEGLTRLRDWARTYGPLYPYQLADLEALTDPNEGLYLTPEQPDWHGFEQGLIDATTLEELEAVKAGVDAEMRKVVMYAWQLGDRFTILKRKAERYAARGGG